MRPLRKFFPASIRHRILGWMAKAGFAVGRSLPRPIGLALFAFLGWACYYILGSDRRLTVSNLKFIFGGEWSKKKIRAVAQAVFISQGKNLFDAVYLSAAKDSVFDNIVSHDSLYNVAEACGRGKGIVAITAHLGCFEMLLHLFARRGLNCFAIGRAFKNPDVDETVRMMRSGPGIEYIDRSESTRKIVRLLQHGKVMGVLIDQDTTTVEGVFADFLGHSAFTPSSAVRFAMKLGIPMFVSVTARQPGDKHRVYVSEEIIPADTGDPKADLVTNIQKINDIISGYIRKHPEQWVWMHERWKTKPDAATSSQPQPQPPPPPAL
ncbi:lipid A biosynthesis lauroyl acyltransferase [Fibrobacteres bacterium R8-0-B4]